MDLTPLYMNEYVVSVLFSKITRRRVCAAIDVYPNAFFCVCVEGVLQNMKFSEKCYVTSILSEMGKGVII